MANIDPELSCYKQTLVRLAPGRHLRTVMAIVISYKQQLLALHIGGFLLLETSFSLHSGDL
jgi:hypothetical protein